MSTDLRTHLAHLIAFDGTDLHLVSGYQPQIRISGRLRPVTNTAALTKDTVLALSTPHLDEPARDRLAATGLTDHAFAIGDLGTFRLALTASDDTATVVIRALPAAA